MTQIPRWLILGGALISVFLITFIIGQGSADKYLGMLGITLNPDSNTAQIGDSMVSPEVSPIKLVTRKVTDEKALVTPIMSPIQNSVTEHTIEPSPSASPVPHINEVLIGIVTPTPVVTAPTSTPESADLQPTSSPLPESTATPVPNEPQASPKVVINEIAWMGTKFSADDEWLELYNAGTQDTSLDGWHLASTDGSPNIALKGSIAAGGYYVIERTDNQTIPDVTANLVASFGHGLSNDGEILVLTDGNADIVDSANGPGAWFAGNNATKASMERINPLEAGTDKSNWASNDGSITVGHDGGGNPIIGTPGARNSVTSPNN